MMQTKIAMILASACAAAGVWAADVYLTANDSSTVPRSYNNAGNWDSGAKPCAGNDYYVLNGYQIRLSSGKFAGDSLTFGNATQNGNAMGWGHCDMTITNLHLYRGTIDCNNEGWLNFWGLMTIHHTASGIRKFRGINQNADCGRNVGFRGTVKTVGTESPKVILEHGKNLAGAYTTFAISGDFTESRAWFEVQGQANGLGIFLLDTATFGLAFDSMKTNAIQLLTNTKLVLTTNALQNANVGISVPVGTQSLFGTRTYCAAGQSTALCKGTQTDYPDYDLLLPVFGSGTFTKVDDGRITLKNDWSGFHGTLAIEGGSLVLTDDMTASSDMRVVVKAGGALETERADGTYGGLDVTFEAGAGLIVPYNAETGVASPITLGASFLDAATFPVGLKLSQPIAFPVNATNRLAVAKVDSAVRVVTGTDFADTTAKTYDLPKTWFEVETDGAGMQTVYLVAKPVITREGEGIWSSFESVYTRASDNLSWTTNYVWSDHLAAHPGADYISTGGVASTNTWGGVGSRSVFHGDSLVWDDNPAFALRSEYTVLTNLTVTKANSMFTCAGYASRSRHRIQGGPITVTAACTYDSPLMFRSTTENNRGNIYTISLDAPLVGPGNVRFRTLAPPNDTWITSESPDFQGCIIVDSNGQGNETTDGLTLHIDSPLALGGLLPASEVRSLTLRGYSYISPTVSMTLDNAYRRSISITTGGTDMGAGGFDVPTNVVLTLTRGFLLNGKMIKKGEGALLLNCSSMSHGGWGGEAANGTNNVVEVRAGGVTTLKKTNINELCYMFKDGGGIAVFQTPPNATQEENGLYATFQHARAFSHEAPIRVKLVPDEPSTPPMSRFSRTICTIPQALNPKTDFAVDKPWDNWRGEVSRADDTPSTGMYRYTVTYRPVGMTILFR